MRHPIEHLDTNAMAWQAAGPGVYTKNVNVDEDSGVRTVLLKLVPEEGFNPPSQIHYHSLSEELLVIDGRTTFDCKMWLEGVSYVYHPPLVIHGFNSATPETTTLLARGPGELDFNFPETVPADVRRPVDGSAPTRELVYLNHIEDQPWEPMYSGGGEQIGERLSLGTDSKTGEGSLFERYFPGWTRPALDKGVPVFDEVYVLEGEIMSSSGAAWTEGHYWYQAPQTPLPALHSSSGALVFKCFG